MITIHDQGTKQFYNAGGSDVITDIDANFTELDNEIDALDIPVKATGAEVATGTNDTKFVTPKALTDAGIPVGLVKANGGDINAGTDDAKFVTSKAIADSNIALTSEIPVKATGTEVNTGTNDDKFVTAKSIADSNVAFTSDVPLVDWKVGTTTYDTSTATGTQNIAHGLGRVPRFVRISMVYDTGSTNPMPVSSIGTYNGTSNKCVFRGLNYAGGNQWRASVADNIVYFEHTNAAEARRAIATATVDGTNIILSWVKTGDCSGIAQLLWEVQ